MRGEGWGGSRLEWAEKPPRRKRSAIEAARLVDGRASRGGGGGSSNEHFTRNCRLLVESSPVVKCAAAIEGEVSTVDDAMAERERETEER